MLSTADVEAMLDTQRAYGLLTANLLLAVPSPADALPTQLLTAGEGSLDFSLSLDRLRLLGVVEAPGESGAIRLTVGASVSIAGGRAIPPGSSSDAPRVVAPQSAGRPDPLAFGDVTLTVTLRLVRHKRAPAADIRDEPSVAALVAGSSFLKAWSTSLLFDLLARLPEFPTAARFQSLRQKQAEWDAEGVRGTEHDGRAIQDGQLRALGASLNDDSLEVETSDAQSVLAIHTSAMELFEFAFPGLVALNAGIPGLFDAMLADSLLPSLTAAIPWGSVLHPIDSLSGDRFQDLVALARPSRFRSLVTDVITTYVAELESSPTDLPSVLGESVADELNDDMARIFVAMLCPHLVMNACLAAPPAHVDSGPNVGDSAFADHLQICTLTWDDPTLRDYFHFPWLEQSEFDFDPGSLKSFESLAFAGYEPPPSGWGPAASVVPMRHWQHLVWSGATEVFLFHHHAVVANGLWRLPFSGTGVYDIIGQGDTDLELSSTQLLLEPGTSAMLTIDGRPIWVEAVGHVDKHGFPTLTVKSMAIESDTELVGSKDLLGFELVITFALTTDWGEVLLSNPFAYHAFGESSIWGTYWDHGNLPCDADADIERIVKHRAKEIIAGFLGDALSGPLEALNVALRVESVSPENLHVAGTAALVADARCMVFAGQYDFAQALLVAGVPVGRVERYVFPGSGIDFAGINIPTLPIRANPRTAACPLPRGAAGGPAVTVSESGLALQPVFDDGIHYPHRTIHVPSERYLTAGVAVPKDFILRDERAGLIDAIYDRGWGAPGKRSKLRDKWSSAIGSASNLGPLPQAQTILQDMFELACWSLIEGMWDLLSKATGSTADVGRPDQTLFRSIDPGFSLRGVYPEAGWGPTDAFIAGSLYAMGRGDHSHFQLIVPYLPPQSLPGEVAGADVVEFDLSKRADVRLWFGTGYRGRVEGFAPALSPLALRDQPASDTYIEPLALFGTDQPIPTSFACVDQAGRIVAIEARVERLGDDRGRRIESAAVLGVRVRSVAWPPIPLSPVLTAASSVVIELMSSVEPPSRLVGTLAIANDVLIENGAARIEMLTANVVSGSATALLTWTGPLPPLRVCRFEVAVTMFQTADDSGFGIEFGTSGPLWLDIDFGEQFVGGSIHDASSYSPFLTSMALGGYGESYPPGSASEERRVLVCVRAVGDPNSPLSLAGRVQGIQIEIGRGVLEYAALAEKVAIDSLWPTVEKGVWSTLSSALTASMVADLQARGVAISGNVAVAQIDGRLHCSYLAGAPPLTRAATARVRTSAYLTGHHFETLETYLEYGGVRVGYDEGLLGLPAPPPNASLVVGAESPARWVASMWLLEELIPGKRVMARLHEVAFLCGGAYATAQLGAIAARVRELVVDVEITTEVLRGGASMGTSSFARRVEITRLYGGPHTSRADSYRADVTSMDIAGYDETLPSGSFPPGGPQRRVWVAARVVGDERGDVSGVRVEIGFPTANYFGHGARSMPTFGVLAVPILAQDGATTLDEGPGRIDGACLVTFSLTFRTHDGLVLARPAPGTADVFSRSVPGRTQISPLADVSRKIEMDYSPGITGPSWTG